MFPFTGFDHGAINAFSDDVYELDKMRLFAGSATPCQSLEAIAISLGYLNNFVELKNCFFIDSFAFGVETCCYATVFGIKNLLCLEVSDIHNESNATLLNRLRLNDIIKVRVGSLQDMFRFDVDIIYLNCTSIYISDLLDEGVLINMIFEMSKKVLPGTYLILVTMLSDLRPAQDFASPHIDVEMSSCMCGKTDEISYVWVCKVINMCSTSSMELSKQKRVRSLKDGR